MRGLEWLRTGSEESLKPVYIIHGDDPYLRHEALKVVVQATIPGDEADIGVSRFQGDATTLADVLDELRTLPFFSKRRVVLVDDADPFVSKYRKELEGYIESPSETGNLILMVKSLPGNTRLAKLTAKAGLAIDCSTPNESDLLPWMTKHATSLKSKLEPAAARLLLELVGPELGLLASEIDKLSIYTADSGTIRRDDVARLVEAGRLENVWKVLDAATEGNGSLAAKLLDDLISAGEHPVPLLAAMVSSLLKVHHAGRLRAARLSLADACRSAGIAPFAVERTGRQHGHLGPGRVDRLPAVLLKADLDIKGGSQLEPRVVLETLLVWLSQPRRD